MKTNFNTIETIKFNNLKNIDCLSFISNVLEIINLSEMNILNIPKDKLKEIYETTNNANKKSLSSDFTPVLKNLDEKRLNTLKGIELITKAYLFHFDEKEINNATILHNLLTKNTKQIYKLSYQEKTTIIKNILESLKEKDFQIILINFNLNVWVEHLEQENNFFEKKYFERNEEKVIKESTFSTSILRKELELEYTNLIKYISALNLLSPSAELTKLINMLNILIKTFNKEAKRKSVKN